MADRIKNKRKLPDVENQVAYIINDNKGISANEQINRQKFNNYIPEGTKEYSSSYTDSVYDTSADRPMVYLGMGTGQREVSTDLMRQMIDKYPDYFNGIDQSSYARLQDSLQNAYRSGVIGPHIFDNLVLRSQGTNPLNGLPLMAAKP